MQQQPRRLDGAGAEEDRAAALATLRPGVLIDHPGDPPVRAGLQAVDEGIGPDLGPAGERERQVGHVHRGLGAVAAALVAIAAVDAGVAQRTALGREIARDHGGRRVGPADAQGIAGARHDARRAVARHGREGVAPPGVPRVVRRPRDADEALHPLVERDEIRHAERPVDAFPALGVQAQVAGVGAGHEGAPVQGRAAHARAAVVGPERLRGRTAAEALVRPVDLVGQRLVEGEVLRREVGAGLQGDHAQAGRGEAREQRRAARARPDHHRIDGLVRAVGLHPVEVHRRASPRNGAGSHASRAPRPSPRKPGRSSASSPGRSPPAPMPEKPSRASAAGWAR